MCSFLSQLDLVHNFRYSRKKSIELSKLGHSLMEFDEKSRDDLLRKLILRLPLINRIIHSSQKNKVSISQFLKDSEGTLNKKKVSTMKWMISFLRKDSNLVPYLKHIIE